ncbi:MAG: hypothetical protein RLZZ245_2798 [Verrucomicrobiota bacterium]
MQHDSPCEPTSDLAQCGRNGQSDSNLDVQAIFNSLSTNPELDAFETRTMSVAEKTRTHSRTVELSGEISQAPQPPRIRNQQVFAAQTVNFQAASTGLKSAALGKPHPPSQQAPIDAQLATDFHPA